MNLGKNESDTEKLAKILKTLGNDCTPFKSSVALVNLQDLLASAENLEQLLPLMFNALGNPNSSYYMALALGRLGDLTLPLLIETAEATNATVRESACLALSQSTASQRESALPVLVKALADTVGGVREAAAKALSAYRPYFHLEPDVIPALVWCLLNDPETEVRYWSASVLESLEDKRIVEPAIQALKDENFRVRATAVNIITANGGETILPTLAEIANNESEEYYVRCAAIHGTAHVGGSTVTDLLVNLTKSSDATVRYTAVMELGRVGNVEVLSLLENIYQFDKGIADIAAMKLLTVKNVAAEAIKAIRERDQPS